MKTNRNTITACILSLFIISAASAAFADKPADWYPMKKGSQWVYDTETTVNKLDPMKVPMTMTVKGTKKIDGVDWFTREAKSEGQVKLQYFRYLKNTVVQMESGPQGNSSPFPMLRIPMTKGRTWTWKGDVEGKPGNSTFTIIGEEEITVPAGTFKTWKVKTKTDDSGKTKARIYTWFAKGVGPVKIELDSTMNSTAGSLKITSKMELKSYDLK